VQLLDASGQSPAVGGQLLTHLLRWLQRWHRDHITICFQLLYELLLLLLLLSLLQQLLPLVACIAVDACCWSDRPGLVQACC
jgi:hypothetical protein